MTYMSMAKVVCYSLPLPSYNDFCSSLLSVQICKMQFGFVHLGIIDPSLRGGESIEDNFLADFPKRASLDKMKL